MGLIFSIKILIEILTIVKDGSIEEPIYDSAIIILTVRRLTNV